MRELKFRAWSNTHQKMVDHNDLILENSDWIGMVCIDGMPIEGPCDSYIQLMQYTGLKDKNGVEIYEGDLVHWGHIAGYTEIIPRKAVVEFDPDISFKTFNLGENNHTFRFGSFAYRNTDKALEVIGNIHQNPELLK